MDWLNEPLFFLALALSMFITLLIRRARRKKQVLEDDDYCPHGFKDWAKCPICSRV